jgi:hypothetical protein
LVLKEFNYYIFSILKKITFLIINKNIMENLINQFETIQIIEQPEKSYKNYNFLCKCDKRYDSFTDFENHVRENHNCRDLTLAHLTGGRRDNNEKIKYF